MTTLRAMRYKPKCEMGLRGCTPKGSQLHLEDTPAWFFSLSSYQLSETRAGWLRLQHPSYTSMGAMC